MSELNVSLWADAYGPYRPEEPLRDEIRADVAIVGAGLNGLSAAFHLASGGEACDVVVLEKGLVGSGSSGRNAGVGLTQFGWNVAAIERVYGQIRAREAYEYASRGLECMRDMVNRYQMDSDPVDRGGIMRIAMDESWLKGLRATQAFYERLGLGDEVTWVEAQTLEEELQSPLLAGVGGLLEENCLFVNPCKHVRELKRLAITAGARVHEQSPVIAIESDPRGLRLATPQGVVVADTVVLAVNAEGHRLPGKVIPRGDQWPIYAYQIATEPLTEADWKGIGGVGKYNLENNMQFFHWFRPTIDRRIVFGGRRLPVADAALARDYEPGIFARLEKDFRAFLPTLKDVRVTHRWGGTISATIDLVPHIGFVDDRRRIFRLNGCWGHGVAMSHVNGQLVADLIRGRQTELTEFWVVDRKSRRWPRGPMRRIGTSVVGAAFTANDEWMLRMAERRAENPLRQRAFGLLRT
jgi:glycine/D-amino acid oxidase-like deaminating enzyme